MQHYKQHAQSGVLLFHLFERAGCGPGDPWGPLNLEMFYLDPTQHPRPSTGHEVLPSAGGQGPARHFEAEEENTNPLERCAKGQRQAATSFFGHRYRNSLNSHPF